MRHIITTFIENIMLVLSQTGGANPPRGLLLAIIFGFQLPVMLGLPVVLGWLLRRRWGVSWSIWFLGALTFVLSQVVHLPVNLALGLLGGGRGVALWPLVPMALAAGLSAGLFEEGARWLMLRTVARRARGWRAGLQFGAGHGGIEAMILGLLVAVNVLSILVLGSLDPAALGLPAETGEQLRTAQAAFWSTPVFLFLVGGLERILAIVAHLAMASLVMCSITRAQPLYWLAALAWHTVLDFWAVWGGQTVGVLWVELGLVVFAAASAWIIWRLREPMPAEKITPAAAPAPTAANLTIRELTDEQLSERVNSSRYEKRS